MMRYLRRLLALERIQALIDFVLFFPFSGLTNKADLVIEYPWQNLEQRLDFKLGSFDWLFVLWSVFVVFHFRFVAVRQILISRHHIILARNKRATVKLKLGIRRGAPMLRKNSLPEAFLPQWALPLWIVFKLFNVWRKMWFTLEVPHSTWAEFYFYKEHCVTNEPHHFSGNT